MNSYDFFIYEFICFMNSYMNSGVPRFQMMDSCLPKLEKYYLVPGLSMKFFFGFNDAKNGPKFGPMFRNSSQPFAKDSQVLQKSCNGHFADVSCHYHLSQRQSPTP